MFGKKKKSEDLTDEEIDSTEAEEVVNKKKPSGKDKMPTTAERIFHQVMPIVLFTLAVFLTWCLVIPSAAGKLGIWLNNFVRGVFSITAYILPIMMFVGAATWKKDAKTKRLFPKFFFSVLFLIAILVIYYIITIPYTERVFSISRFYSLGKELDGGGFLGSIVGYGLWKGIGTFGIWVFAIASVFLYFIVVFNVNIGTVLLKLGKKLKLSFTDYKEQRKEKIREYHEQNEENREREKAEEDIERANRRSASGNAVPPVINSDRLVSDGTAGNAPRRHLFSEEEDELLEDNIPTRRKLQEINQDIPQISAPRVTSFNGGRIIIEDDDEPAIAVDDDFDLSEIDRTLTPVKLPRGRRSRNQENSDAPVRKIKELQTVNDFANITEYSLFDTLTEDDEDEEEDVISEEIAETSDAPSPSHARDINQLVSLLDDDDELEDSHGEPEPLEEDDGITAETSYVDRSEKNIFADDEDDKEEILFDEAPSNDYSDIYEEDSEYIEEESEDTEEIITESKAFDFEEEEDEPVKEIIRPQPTSPQRPVPKKTVIKEYQFPPVELLTSAVRITDYAAENEDRERIEKLEKTLANLKLPAKVVNVCRGPRITRYELKTDQTIEVKRYARAINNISMNLESSGIRMETPIPGKSTIGIEVPNKVSSTVQIRALIDTEEFRSKPSTTTICIGCDVAGKPIYGDIAKMPHMLIAGATGMGKSVCINTLITSILYKASPDQVKLILIDPKKVEFNVYKGIPHLLVPVVTDMKKAAGALSWAVNEMERRYDLIEEAGVRNIEGYNSIAVNNPGSEVLTKIVIIIDELNDLMMMAKESVEGSIMRIAQKARAAGIHLIIGTQRPSVNVITGVIKANIPSRIAFKVTSNIDSRTIFESPEVSADKLLNNGDMLYFPVGFAAPLRVQGAFMSDSEVDAVVSFLRNNTPEGYGYDEDIWSDIELEAKKCEQNGKRTSDSGDEGVSKSGLDALLSNEEFCQALELAIDLGEISASKIQTELSIGFQKASRFVSNMEKHGFISEPNGQKPRKTLIDRNQYTELLNSMEI